MEWHDVWHSTSVTGRVAGVLLLSLCANHLHRITLDYIDQFVMAYGGLRGVITFALVVLLDENTYSQRYLLITTTVVVIYFTNFLLVISTVSAVTVSFSAKTECRNFNWDTVHAAFVLFELLMKVSQNVLNTLHVEMAK